MTLPPLDEKPGIKRRLQRWLATLGKPIGPGRANPDNDLIYLLQDALECIAELESERDAWKENAEALRSTLQHTEETLGKMSFIAASTEARLAEATAVIEAVKWKSADRDNMEFKAHITYTLMDRIRTFLTGDQHHEG